jgi:hypothetical protein
MRLRRSAAAENTMLLVRRVFKGYHAFYIRHDGCQVRFATRWRRHALEEVGYAVLEPWDDVLPGDRVIFV